jgi:hypothetical protein
VLATFGRGRLTVPSADEHQSDSDCNRPTQGHRARKEDDGADSLDHHFVPLYRGQPSLDVLEELDGLIE